MYFNILFFLIFSSFGFAKQINFHEDKTHKKTLKKHRKLQKLFNNLNNPEPIKNFIEALSYVDYQLLVAFAKKKDSSLLGLLEAYPPNTNLIKNTVKLDPRIVQLTEIINQHQEKIVWDNQTPLQTSNNLSKLSKKVGGWRKYISPTQQELISFHQLNWYDLRIFFEIKRYFLSQYEEEKLNIISDSYSNKTLNNILASWHAEFIPNFEINHVCSERVSAFTNIFFKNPRCAKREWEFLYLEEKQQIEQYLTNEEKRIISSWIDYLNQDMNVIPSSQEIELLSFEDIDRNYMRSSFNFPSTHETAIFWKRLMDEKIWRIIKKLDYPQKSDSQIKWLLAEFNTFKKKDREFLIYYAYKSKFKKPFFLKRIFSSLGYLEVPYDKLKSETFRLEY